MKRILAFAATLSIIASFVPLTVGAVEYGGLGGRPANPRADNPRSESIFIYQLPQNQTITDGIRLFNNTGETKTIGLGSVDSAPSNDGAFACSQEADPKNDVGAWITFDRNEVTLENGKDTVVNFTVKAPSNASVGEHSGCVTIRDTQQAPAANQNGVVLSFRSAIRVAVTIPGDIVKAISFTGLDVQRNKTNPSLYTIQPSVVNTGNVSLDIDLDIRLKNVFGGTVTSKKATYPVLPATSARWNFDVDRPFWGGWYTAQATAQYNSNTADGIGESSSAQRETVSSESKVIFVAPSPLAFIIEWIILLLTIGIIGTLIIRRRQQREVAASWRNHKIKDGETLKTIAAKHAITWQHLARANNLKAPYSITEGEKIKVPPRTPKKTK